MIVVRYAETDAYTVILKCIESICGHDFLNTELFPVQMRGRCKRSQTITGTA